MQEDIVALIKEATRPDTKTRTYIARLGLRRLLKNERSHKPFFTVPVVQSFYEATQAVVKSLSIRYDSKNALKGAFNTRTALFDEAINNVLKDGHKIWNSEDPRHAVTQMDESQGPFDTTELNGHYPRHLLFEDPSDQHEYVFSNVHLHETNVELAEFESRFLAGSSSAPLAPFKT
jgi:hypothetical protein